MSTITATVVIVFWLHLNSSGRWVDTPSLDLPSVIEQQKPGPPEYTLCWPLSPDMWRRLVIEYPEGVARIRPETPSVGFPGGMVCRVDAPEPSPNNCQPEPRVGCWVSSCGPDGVEYTPCTPELPDSL